MEESGRAKSSIRLRLVAYLSHHHHANQRYKFAFQVTPFSARPVLVLPNKLQTIVDSPQEGSDAWNENLGQQPILVHLFPPHLGCKQIQRVSSINRLRERRCACHGCESLIAPFSLLILAALQV